ncbi:MAG: Hpt domain-containing protein [Candidatus Competibacteraceae bacterium]
MAATSSTSEPTPEEQVSVINAAKFAELKELLGSELGHLIDSFEHLGQTTVQTLRQTLERGDKDTAAKAIHRLKGSCGNVGAQQLLELCRTLETAIGQGEEADLADSINALAEAHNRACGQLRVHSEKFD